MGQVSSIRATVKPWLFFPYHSRIFDGEATRKDQTSSYLIVSTHMQKTSSNLRILVLIITVVVLVSCDNKTGNNQTDYSDNFYTTIKNSGIELRKDSLLFPVESGIEEPILIPTILILKKEYDFLSETGLKLKLKRINFTDIEYKLQGDELDENGIVSLRPTFYLGAESVETSEGGFWVTDYVVVDSKFIRTIKIGNEGFSDDVVEDVYVHVIPKTDCDYKKLVEIDELWKLKNE